MYETCIRSKGSGLVKLESVEKIVIGSQEDIFSLLKVQNSSSYGKKMTISRDDQSNLLTQTSSDVKHKYA